MRRRYAPLLIALCLALGIAVPLLYGGSESFTELARLPGWAYVPLAAMVLLAWLCNALRLYLLAGGLDYPMRLRHSYAIVGATDFAASITPAGSGGLATKLYALHHHGVPVSGGMAIFAVDRLLDFAWFALAMPATALWWALAGSDASSTLHLGAILIVLPVLGLVLLILLLRHHRAVLALLARALQRFAPRRHRWRFARLLVQFRRAVAALLGVEHRRLLLVYLCCAGHWLLRYGVLPVLLWCIGVDIPWTYLFVVQGLVLLGGQVTMLPGGGGSVELGLGLFLSPYLTPPTTAAVLLAWRGFTYYGALILGAVFFVWTVGRTSRRGLMNCSDLPFDQHQHVAVRNMRRR